MNLFAEAARNATSIVTPNLYSGVEVKEYDYQMAYAECLNLAYTIPENMRLHAESMDPLIERMGLMGAFLYSEAEGGFFKRILDALIKLFEKVKGFFSALLGRFKSNKSYREDLALIQGAFEKDSYKYTDKAVLKVPKHRWEALAGIVNNILKKDSLVFTEKYDGTTITAVVDSSKALITVLESNSMSADAGEGSKKVVENIKKTMQYIQKEFSAVDAWVKYILEVATKGTKTGDANFGKNSPKTAQENVNALWASDFEEVKGSKVGSRDGEYFGSFIIAIASLSIDNILPALEEGEKFFKDKADELKSNLNDLDRVSKRVSENSSSAAVNKSVAQEASNIASTYSTVITNYSTMVITSFNTSKTVFDKLLVEGKKMVDALDKVRKDAGNVTAAV